MKQQRNTWVWLSTILLLTATLLGCKEDTDPLRWTEDVKLPDGRIVTLTRYQEFKGPHELGQPPSASNYWFEFINPDSGKLVRWEQSTVTQYLAGVALIMHKGFPYLLTMPAMGRSWENHKCPNPVYILFLNQKGNEWTQVPIQYMPLRKIRANMTFDAQSKAATFKEFNYKLKDSQTSNSHIGAHQEFKIDLPEKIVQKFDWPNCNDFNLSLKNTGRN